jgi:hypothetical protein
MRMRSTMAPEMRAGVMTANMAWKSMKARCGMAGEKEGSAAPLTPERPAHCRPPMNLLRPPPGAKERL